MISSHWLVPSQYLTPSSILGFVVKIIPHNAPDSRSQYACEGERWAIFKRGCVNRRDGRWKIGLFLINWVCVCVCLCLSVWLGNATNLYPQAHGWYSSSFTGEEHCAGISDSLTDHCIHINPNDLVWLRISTPAQWWLMNTNNWM